jgi:hypothetical protein
MESVATKRIEALYQVRDEQAVFAFLEAHSFLVPLLLEAHSQIKVYFPDAPLFLEMFIDPDAVGIQSLEIAIGTQMDVDTAFAKLTELDYSWALKRLDDAQGKLGIHLEMVKQ